MSSQKFVITWQQPNIVTSRIKKPFVFKQLSYHTLNERKNKIYILGGIKPKRHVNLFIYNVDTGGIRYISSIKNEEMVKGISGHCVCELSPKKFLVGIGEIEDNVFSDDMYILDIEKKEWRKANCNGTWEVPRRLEGYTWNMLDGKIYMIGGGGELSYVNCVHVYDIQSNTWKKLSQKGNNAPPPIFYHTSLVYEEKIYIFGGCLHSRKVHETNTKWVYVYDYKKNVWLNKIKVLKEAMGNSFAGGNAILFKDQYVLLLNNRMKNYSCVYDLKNNIWYNSDEIKTIGIIPNDLDVGRVIECKERIFVIGGNTQINLTVNYGVYELDIEIIESKNEKKEENEGKKEEK